MADAKIGRAVLELTVDDKQYKLALGQIEKDSKKTADSVRGIGQAINLAVFREFASVAVGAVKAVAGGFAELVQRGSTVQGIENAFDKLTGAIGLSRDTMLDTTRTATKGLISDFDLMAASNKAMLLGLPVTTDSMGTMAEAAVTLGRAMGQDATKSFDDLITALGRGSPLILDNLGITVKVSEANEAYARSLKKSASDLTEGEKKLAFYNAAMEAARKKVAEIGGIHLTLADQVKIALVTWQNFTDALGVAINRSPVLSAGLGAINAAMQEAFGPRQKDTIQLVVGVIERLAVFTVDLGRATISVASGIVTAYQSVKIAINTVIAAALDGVKVVLDFLAVLGEKSSFLPVVGEMYAEMARETRAASATVGLFAANFRDLARDQAAATVGMQDGLAKVDGVLVKVKDAMLAAMGAARTSGPAISSAIGKAAEDAAMRTSEQTKAIAAAYRTLAEEVVLSTKDEYSRRLTEIAFAQEAEIAKLRELKGVKATELEGMLVLVREKYAAMTAAAIAAGDPVKQKAAELQAELTMMVTTGTAARVLQIEQERDRELLALETKRVAYGVQYESIRASVVQKYELMTQAAQGHFATVQAAGEAFGFKTRDELQKTADIAVATYERMKASGLYTTQQLEDAFIKSENAKREAQGKREKMQMTSEQAILSGTLDLMRTLGEKYKAAAIAGAIISTYMAISKALASAPWPASLVLAAAAGAQGWAQVNAIRNSDAGWREGTPSLDYVNFGRESLQPLHGDEAVVPRGKGHMLAAEIADAMPRNEEQTALLSRIADAMEQLPAAMRRQMVNGSLIGV